MVHVKVQEAGRVVGGVLRHTRQPEIHPSYPARELPNRVERLRQLRERSLVRSAKALLSNQVGRVYFVTGFCGTRGRQDAESPARIASPRRNTLSLRVPLCVLDRTTAKQVLVS